MVIKTFYRAKQEERIAYGTSIDHSFPLGTMNLFGIGNFFRYNRTSERALNSSTGVMKIMKKTDTESKLSCRLFLIFPGCMASGRRCSTASPWTCGSAQPFLSGTCLIRDHFCMLAKRFMHVASSGKPCESVRTCVRKMGQGSMTLVGCGVKPHERFPL